MKSHPAVFNPKLDLTETWEVAIARSLLWRAWTEPQILKQWFCPKPWHVTDCVVDLSPGGVFRTDMAGPNGEGHTTEGCYLHIVPEHRLVWTLMLLPGFRPAPNPFLPFTATITFEDSAKGTKYTAHLQHADEATRQRHADMGFPQGWSTALDQLVAIADEIT